MHVIGRYAGNAAQAEDCVRRNPFAVLVSGSPPMATQLPLLVDDALVPGARLLGHLARANPHVARLRDDPTALAIFTGPNGYISPSWFSDRTQAPTWNYAAVHVSVVVRLRDEPAFTEMTVDRLTETLEAGRNRAWTTSELGARRQRLLAAIVGFEAEIITIESQFRLSQFEPAAQASEIAAGLETEGNTALAVALRAARPAEDAS